MTMCISADESLSWFLKINLGSLPNIEHQANPQLKRQEFLLTEANTLLGNLMVVVKENNNSKKHPSCQQCWPAGTGTITVFLCLVCPVPWQVWQGLEMTVPLPPQRRHVERITNGPVFIVSYREENTTVEETHTKHTDTRKALYVGGITMPEPLQWWQCWTLVPGS